MRYLSLNSVKCWLLTLVLFTPLAFATEQIRDLVEYEGEVYELEIFLGYTPKEPAPMWIFPLEEYDEKTSGEDYIFGLYPEHGEGGTSLCWRNYVGKYLIKDDKFYLDKLIPFAVYWDKVTSMGDIPEAQKERHYQDFVRTTPGLPLARINPQWKSPVFADWFSGKVCLKSEAVESEASESEASESEASEDEASEDEAGESGTVEHIVEIQNGKIISLLTPALAKEQADQKYATAYQLFEEQNYSEALPMLRELVKQEHAQALYALGYAYFKGLGVEEDVSIATQWLRKADEHGSVDAPTALTALGVPTGEIAAEMKAKFEAALELYNDDDYAAATPIFHKLAEQGYADAQRQLGFMYSLGFGVKENVATSVKWYKKAAEQGDADAQLELGNYYTDETKGGKNLAEAAKWYLRAAEQRNAEAQHRLVHIYLDGKGVAQNRQEAKRWFDEIGKDMGKYIYCGDCEGIKW